jgi:hypothetical protein
VPSKIKQIEPDGSLVLDYDPDRVTFEDQKQIIEDGLQARGWTVAFQQGDKQARRRFFRMSKGGISFHVTTYIFPNLAWSSGGRSEDEKRIQLSRPYEEHASDFNLPKNGDPRSALLGIYRRKGKIVICAWDAAAYKGHATPTSCYVRVDAMASAMRSGFGQGMDSKGRLVCCFTPDMLAYYLENMSFLHEHVIVSDALIKPSPESENGASSDVEDDIDLPEQAVSAPEDLPRNRIFYGAPGTGKSHNLDADLKSFFPIDGFYERTTFYPDYTNGTFVGEYKPFPVYRRGDGKLVGPDQKSEVPDLEPMIDYRFVPGPFLRVLAKARRYPEHNFCLVIEEINRAHASAVFGEVFQMLDRVNDGDGKFSVSLSREAQNYLASLGIHGPVKIPANMYIWATMNSADQGVLPLDAAFKRRWSLEYVGIDDGEDVVADWTIQLKFLEEPIKWNDFRKAINSHLQKHGVTEDRLLGPFFMTEKDLNRSDAFENKLLQYLRDDVVRSAPGKLFVGESLTYGALVRAYRDGKYIFVPEVVLGASE